MHKPTSHDFGSETIGKLLIKQAVPASIGILVMSLNILVDTIFVGHWIGSQAIAAINVVLPVSFFIAALGMSIGIGGSSIISRALGAKEDSIGNQMKNQKDKSKNTVEVKKAESIADQLASSMPNNKKGD